MKKLPVGISTLSEIIERGYLYVDKTPHVAHLVDQGKYFFLSRPRRFGKSLLVDTLKQAFLSNQKLFQGLYLENHWDWSVQYPVIHLSFGNSSAYQGETRLLNLITQMLQNHAKDYGVSLESQDYGIAFQELIRKLADKYQEQVVLLIDEYDKPILDVIHRSEEAIQSREILKGLYAGIKDSDPYLKFVLLTGVSKFSKVSLFSGLNNLSDITLDEPYADLCGYTQAELEATFAEHLNAKPVDLKTLKQWYNGYNFAGRDEQKVYNPFDILLFFSRGYRYHPYWFESATPTFLVRMIEKHAYFVPELEGTIVSDELLSTFDLENMPLETLLFQTGYLTIKQVAMIGLQYGYELTYPNLEVKMSLNTHLASIGTSSSTHTNKNLARLAKVLLTQELNELESIFQSMFASIPYDWYKKHDMHRYEGFYASIVYSYLAALGYTLIPEDITNQGKIDLTMKLPDKIIIFEFKLNRYGTACEAIEQIKTKHYPQKYQSEAKPIYLVGMSFDDTKKNLEDFVVEAYA